MEAEKFLPLGTIVRAKGSVKKIMIIGRALKIKNETLSEPKYFDYSAVLYPEGMIGDSFVYLMHEDIDEIVYPGFDDEENTRMVKIIKEAVAADEHNSNP